MIKLETKRLAPSAVTTLEIRSSGEASVILQTTDHGAFIDEQWVASVRGKRKQQVTFIGADGQASTLEGPVDEVEAVEIAVAHKVVVQVRLSTLLLATGGAGRKSKEASAIEIVRVMEVWDTPQQCLWRAEDSAKSAKSAAVMGTDGKITKAA